MSKDGLRSEHLFLLGSNHRREKLLVSSALPRTRDLPDDEEEKDGLPHHHHHTRSHHVTVDGRSFRSWVGGPPPSLSHCRLFLSAADEPDDESDACNRDLLGLSRVSRKNLCLTTLASPGQCDHCGLGMGSVLSDPRVPEGLPPSLCTLVTPSSRRDIHNYVEYPLHSFCARSGPPPSVQFSPKLFRAHLSSRQILLPAGKDLLVRLMYLSQAVEATTLETLCSLSSRSASGKDGSFQGISVSAVGG